MASTLLPLTGNPLLSGLSWLSSSRPRDLLSVPGHITVRRMLSPAILLPTPAHVERSTRDTNPMGGFAAKPLLTNFEHDGQFDCKNRTGLSASPTFDSKNLRITYRIEQRDYSSGIQSQPYYFFEPPSSWTNTSRRIQLYCNMVRVLVRHSP